MSFDILAWGIVVLAVAALVNLAYRNRNHLKYVSAEVVMPYMGILVTHTRPAPSRRRTKRKGCASSMSYERC